MTPLYHGSIDHGDNSHYDNSPGIAVEFLPRHPFHEVRRHWRNYFDENAPYKLDVKIRHYMTAGAAVASRERFKLIGRWSDTVRTIDIHSVGVKRQPDGRKNEFYCTMTKINGPMNPKTVKEFPAVLDAPERDVAACSRSGEALRCRFLVRWLPAENPAPDELSWPCDPEWLNPDYDEGEDVGLTMTKEDEDTAEILIGG